MWKFILQAVVSLSKNPVVREWVKKKAVDLIMKRLDKTHAANVAVAKVAGIEYPAILRNA